VTALELSPEAVEDLDQLVDFLAEVNPLSAGALVDDLLDALAILTAHPLVGRPTAGGLCELVISRGKTGYIALYAYDEVRDRALVLAVRHQREAGYT
jgi:plasmid stabilization system protein ParE